MNSRERVLAFLAGQRVDRLPCMPLTMMFASDYIGRKYPGYRYLGIGTFFLARGTVT